MAFVWGHPVSDMHYYYYDKFISINKFCCTVWYFIPYYLFRELKFVILFFKWN